MASTSEKTLIGNFEEFTEKEVQILERYVTNTRGSIFALRNLPEVIKGALFSRYSRSNLGLRPLLLKEFICDGDEAAFSAILGETSQGSQEADRQLAAIKKAQSFYDRILDGYGDDSIGELGGAHLALENISMIAAKAVEDSRIGGAPLEKSTRYMYFDQKVHGEYLYYREPILMTSAFRDLFLSTCNMLFDTYVKLIPPMTTFIEARFPKEAEITKAAYAAATRAKVLDCLRGLLPAATLTNVGFFGNGRFFEYLIQKLSCHNLVELQEIGKKSYEELAKVIPSFVRRAESGHKYLRSYQQFFESMSQELKLMTEHHASMAEKSMEPGVKLLTADPDAIYKVAAALLFPMSDRGLGDLLEYVKKLPAEELYRIFDAAHGARENRRHKSPRALEHAHFTFEFLSDFGSFRDLHRHRILTQERQLLCCDYGYYIPDEIIEAGQEEEYRHALDMGKDAFEAIRSSLPEEAQYVVPMAYNIRWYFEANLRELVWLCELRSSPAGHSQYRRIAQEIAKEIARVEPAFERFFKFVDFNGYELGRLGQEQKKALKRGLD
jgi:thymidylate synthase ThyX